MNIYFRTLSFLIIWIFYLVFMNKFAPMGTDWTSWNFQRIYNFSEYLKINGYFSSYGFSIWSKCENCDLRSNFWEGGIYLSHNLIINLPYILINHFFGKDGLMFYGPLFDKLIIFLTAVMLTEIILNLSKQKFSKFNNYLIAFIVFIFFTVNPWTYKMIIAPWYFVYFLFFFFLGVYLLLKNKFNFALISFVLCSFFDEQSSFGLLIYYLLILSISYFFKQKINLEKNSIMLNLNHKKLKFLFIALLAPIVINISVMLFAYSKLNNVIGSSLLYRIGISGSDIHNGGIIGSMQFLSGNRITSCILNYDGFNFLNKNTPLIDLIEIYNCFLSLLGMFLISIFSIYGIIILYKKFKEFRVLVLPISFLLISYLTILQQASSAHLMGYSYLFSVLFSLGIMAIIVNLINNKQLILSKIILIIPFVIGIIFLCIRVSMLTGVNS